MSLKGGFSYKMMDFVLPRFFWTIVNFCVLFAIVSKIFLKRVNRVIDERNSEIKSNIDKAQENKKRSEELRIENENEYKLARKKGKDIVASYKAKAENISEEIVSDAHKEARRIIERARKEIEREQQRAEEDIKIKVVDLSLELSKKALNQSIDEEVHRKLIQDFISNVGD